MDTLFMTVMMKLNEAHEKGRKELLEFFKDVLPLIIFDHNLYETENQKMSSEDVATFIYEKLDLTGKVIGDYASASIFFSPGERGRREISSLSREVFNGRYDPELYAEYGHWLMYITDIFLPICDSDSGDFRVLPFSGGVS